MVPDENITLRQFQSLSSRFVQLDHLYVRLPNGQVVSMAEDRKYMLNAVDVDFNDQDTKYYADNITITGYIEDVENPGPNEPNTRNVFGVLDISSKLTGDTTITITPNSQTHITTIKINNLRSRLTYNNGISLSSLEGVDEGITRIGINHNNTLSSDFNNIGVYNIYDRLSAGEGISITQGENGITNISSNLQPNWIVQTITSPVIAQHNHRYVTKKSGGNCSVTLPQNPSNGDRVSIFVDQVDIDREHGQTIQLSIKNPYNTITLMEHVIPINDNLDLDLLNYAELNFINGTWQVSLLTFESDTQYYDGDFIQINQNNEINCTLTRLGQLQNDVGYITSDSFLQDAKYVKGTYNESTKEFSEDGENRYLKLTFAVSGNNGIVSKDEYLDVTELFEGYSEGFGIQLSNSQITLTGTVLTGDETHVFIRNNIISTNFKGSEYIDVSDDGTISFTGTDGSSVSSLPYTNGFGLALSSNEEEHQFRLTGTILSSGTNIEIENNKINNLLSGGNYININNDDHSINFTLSAGRFISYDNNAINNELYSDNRTINITSTGIIEVKPGTTTNQILSTTIIDEKLSAVWIDNPGYITSGNVPSATPINDGRYIKISGSNNTVNWTLSTQYPIYIDDENNLIALSSAGSSVVKILKSVSGDIKWEDETILTSGKFIEIDQNNAINSLISGDDKHIFVVESSQYPNYGIISTNLHDYSSGRFIEISGDNYSINCTLTGLDQLQNTPGYITSTSIPGATPITSGRFIEVTGALNSINNTMEMFDGVNTSALLHYKTIIDNSDPENPIQKQVEDGYQIDCLLSGDGTHVFVDNITHTISTNFHGSSNIIVSDDGTISCTLRGWDGNDDNTQYTSGRFIEIGSAMVDGKWPINSILSGEYPIYIDEDSNLVKITPAGSSVIKVLKSVSGTISWQDNTTNLSGGRYININENNGIDNLLSGDEKTIKITSAGVIYIPSGTVGQLLSTTANGTEWVDNPGYITNADLPCGTVYATDFGLASKGASNNIFYLTGTVLSGGTNIEIENNYINCLLSGGKYIDVNNETHSISTILHGDNTTIKILDDGTISSIIPSGAPGKDGQDGRDGRDGRDGDLLSGRVNINVTEDNYIDCLLSSGKFIDVDNETHAINCLLSGDGTIIDIDGNGLIYIKPGADNKVLKSNGNSVYWGDDDKGQDGSNYYSGRFNVVSSDNTINSTLSGDETTIHIFEDTGIISCLVSSIPPIEYTGISPIVINPETHVISFNGDLIDDDTKYYADGTTLTGYVENSENYFKVWDIYSRLSAGPNISLDHDIDTGITTISAAGNYLTSSDLFEGKNIAISTHYTKVNDVDVPNGLQIINLLSGGRFTEVDDITHAINSTLSGSGVIKIEDGYIQLIPANTDDYILKTTGGEVKWGPPPPAGGNNYYYTSTYLNGFGLGLSTDASDDNWFYLTGTILSGGRHTEITSTNLINCLLSGSQYIFIDENSHIISTNLHGDETTIHIDENTGTICSLVQAKNYNGDNTYIQVDGSTIKWIGGNLGNTYYEGPGIDIYNSDGKDYISTLISGGPNVNVYYENNYAVISSYVPSTNTYSKGFGIDIQQDPTTIEGQETLAHPNNYIISTTLVGDNKHIKVTEDVVISSLLKGTGVVEVDDNGNIKIKPSDTNNYVLKTVDGTVMWDSLPPAGGDTWNVTCTTVLSGLGFPRYNVLNDNQVSQSTIPLTSLAQGQSFLIPVQSGIPVKWYTPSGYVTARYAPDTNTEDGEVVNLTSYLEKGVNFTPSANGYIRLSVFDDGSYPGDCLRLIFNDGEWGNGYPLYRFKGNNNKIYIDNETLTSKLSAITPNLTANVYQVWNLSSRLAAGPNIELTTDEYTGITTISAAGGGSNPPTPTPTISSYIYAAADSNGRSHSTTPITDPYINLVETDNNNTWINSYIHLLGAGNVSVSALNGIVTISGASSTTSTSLYAGTGTTKQNDTVTENGKVKIKLFDDDTFRSSIGFSGTGGTNVTCNNGIVTINSTDSNTHYTTTLYAGSGITKRNDVISTNGDVDLKLFDDDEHRSSIGFIGAGNINVTSENGNIIISGFPAPPTNSGIVLLGFDPNSGYFWFPTAQCD